MAFWDTVKDVGLGVATLGGSEIAKGLVNSTQSDFQAQGIPLQNPITPEQLQQAQQQQQEALQQQQAFVNALNAAGGVQNQSQVYNQLQDIAAGKGPNPAQAQLNQATGQNVANQAALMASQRGASANPALIARLAAQQGGALQQQAAGQAATLQAQQALNAIGQAGGIAGQQAALQGQAIGGLNQFAQNAQGQLLGAQQGFQGQQLQQQMGLNQLNAGVAAQNQQSQNAIIGGLLSGAGAAGTAMAGGKYNGGMIKKSYADGGEVSGQRKALSKAGQFLTGFGNQMGGQNNPLQQGVSQGLAGLGAGLGAIMKRPMNAPIKPMQQIPMAGEPVVDPTKPMAYGGGKIDMGHKLKQGGKVPGKAKVAGDSPKNDTVEAKLSPGEVVIKRTDVQKIKQDPSKAGSIVAAILGISASKPKSKK